MLDGVGQNLNNDHFCAAAWIDSLLDLGEYERAAKLFAEWPGSTETFDYSRLNAVILEDVKNDYEAAALAYNEALGTWPGPSDWRLIHRKAGCLARMGKRDEAAKLRERAATVENLMEDGVHRRLRFVLGSLDEPNSIREIIAFYRELGRQLEVDAWSRELALRVAETLE